MTVHRRHVSLAVLLLTLAIALSAWWWRGKQTSVPVSDIAPRKVVALDAGHGGPDPGAIGVSGAKEKHITLAIALKVEEVLLHAGIETVMTRKDDSDLVRGDDVPHRQREDLMRRARLVNDSGAHVFVSLHANSFPSSTWSGAQTFFLEGDADGFRLATHVQSALVRELGPNRRRAAAAELRLLREARGPAVVVEVGFLSNPAEEALLRSSDYQGRVAQAIANGILAFFDEQERRREFPDEALQ